MEYGKIFADMSDDAVVFGGCVYLYTDNVLLKMPASVDGNSYAEVTTFVNDNRVGFHIVPHDAALFAEIPVYGEDGGYPLRSIKTLFPVTGYKGFRELSDFHFMLVGKETEDLCEKNTSFVLKSDVWQVTTDSDTACYLTNDFLDKKSIIQKQIAETKGSICFIHAFDAPDSVDVMRQGELRLTAPWKEFQTEFKQGLFASDEIHALESVKTEILKKIKWFVGFYQEAWLEFLTDEFSVSEALLPEHNSFLWDVRMVNDAYCDDDSTSYIPFSLTTAAMLFGTDALDADGCFPLPVPEKFRVYDKNKVLARFLGWLPFHREEEGFVLD
jgi:hypothetical protein